MIGWQVHLLVEPVQYRMKSVSEPTSSLTLTHWFLSFDADLPIEVDDEYWECEDPEQSWKQPPGKPSKVTAFNLHLRLCEILAFTLRTLYSNKKSKLLTGLIGDQWEERVVTELDSSMNKWKDSLPDHCSYCFFILQLDWIVVSQCDGIQINLSIHSFINLHLFIQHFTTFRFRYIALSFTEQLRYHSHRLRYVQMQHVYVVTSSMRRVPGGYTRIPIYSLSGHFYCRLRNA